MQFLAAVAIRYASTIAQFGVTLIVAHRLHPGGVGAYLIVYGAVSSTYVGAGLGAPDGLVRLAPALSASGDHLGAARLVRGTVRTSCLTSLVLAFVAGVVLYVASGSLSLGLVGMAWWYGYAVAYVTSQALVAAGSPTFGTFMYYGAINWFTLVAVAMYSVLVARDSVIGMAVVTAIGAMAAGCLGLVSLGRQLPRGTTTPIRLAEVVTVSRAGLPLSAGRIVQSLIIWSPVWLVGAILGADHAASVALASRLVMAVGAAVAAVRFSVRPRLVKLAHVGDWARIETEGRRIAIAATALCVGAAAGDVCLGPLLLPRIFGPEYQSLWWIILVLLVGIVAESMAGPTDEALKMSDGAMFVLGAECAVLLTTCLVQVVAGALWGTPGMLVASTLSFVGLYMTIVGEVERRRGVRPAILPPLHVPRVSSRAVRPNAPVEPAVRH